MKKYIKGKKKKGPSQTNPKFGTPSSFIGKSFGGQKPPQPKFNPAQFKVQHKG